MDTTTLYIIRSEKDSGSDSPLHVVSTFLGINIEDIDREQLLTINPYKDPHVAIIYAHTLDQWTEQEISILISKLKNEELKLMIIFDQKTNNVSARSFQHVTSYSAEITEGYVTFQDGEKNLLRELRGIKIPVKINRNGYFLKPTCNDSHESLKPLIWLEDHSGIHYYLMLMQKIERVDLFFAVISDYIFVTKDPYYRKISTLLPFLIFLKQAFGEKCWHRKTNQANFTIDDPWLREPYGNLSYSSLLREMENSNFHTTIAFIPWNFNRNKKEVVNLFLQYPERYSIAVHGNNHDRHEFNTYDQVPLNKQESDIRQALARMQSFRKLTGVPFDPVMVFPHNICPENTVPILKRFNFLASTNSQSIPLGNPFPDDPDLVLWPTLLRYGSFPLLRRLPPSVYKCFIAIELFLEKPLIFYTHQNFFAKSISAFNPVAQYVNLTSLRGIKWVNLEGIAENLYMERLKEPGVYDIMMMSRKILLRNFTSDQLWYHIINNVETECTEISKITIGNNTFSKNDISILLKPISLNPGESIRIEITFQNDIKLDSIRINKSEFRIRCIRWLSDVKDILLSRNAIFRYLYYGKW